MRKQLSTTFSALDELTSTSLDPSPSLGHVLLRGDTNSRVIESLLSRLATTATPASSGAVSTQAGDPAPAPGQIYRPQPTTLAPNGASSSPTPAAVPFVSYPYAASPPSAQYSSAPQQPHPLYYLPAHPDPSLDYGMQPTAPLTGGRPVFDYPPHQQNSSALTASLCTATTSEPANTYDRWPSTLPTVATAPRSVWGSSRFPVDSPTTTGGAAPFLWPDSPCTFSSSPFASTSQLPLFSPGFCSSAENLTAFGEQPAITADRFLGEVDHSTAADTARDVAYMPATKRPRNDASKRHSDLDHATYFIDRDHCPDMLRQPLDSTAGATTDHVPSASGERKRKSSLEHSATSKEWFGSESPDSSFFTGSTSSLPLEVFGATSSFSPKKRHASNDFSSVPSPSSPLAPVYFPPPPQRSRSMSSGHDFSSSSSLVPPPPGVPLHDTTTRWHSTAEAQGHDYRQPLDTAAGEVVEQPTGTPAVDPSPPSPSSSP